MAHQLVERIAGGAAGKVLIVDDEPANVELMRILIGRLGYDTATATNGEAALDEVAHAHPDLVLLDVNMPNLDGFEVCRRLKSNPATRLIPVVLLTGLSGTDERIRGIEAGADDFVSKPFVRAEFEARIRSLTRLKRYTDELDSAASVLLSLGRTVEARDPYTQGHCERLASYATALGAQLGLSEEQQLALRRGGYLHDVGKVGIPDAVLLKPDRLDPHEYAVIQEHPVIGHSICVGLRILKDVSPIVRHHHERLDGTGYPDQLTGDDIPLLAQLMGIVDAYDAMTSARPYKEALTPEQALKELRREVSAGWKSARLVEEFAAIAPRLKCEDGSPPGTAAFTAEHVATEPPFVRRVKINIHC